MEAETYTAIVTDPPAGIAFMGKAWDKDKGGRDKWIAWMAEVAAECLRVCKPGAHALVWALPRTSHWTATAWEDAGWEVRDRVAFAFGSGFPKSQAIGKALDKKAGAKREVVGASGNGSLFSPAVPHFMVSAGVVNENRYADNMITAPATDDAKTWEGYGTALKPAMEDWWVLRKPISEKSIAENCVKHGCGALNIDGSRVGTDTRTFSGHKGPQGITAGASIGGTQGGYNFKPGPETTVTGRWPANLCHDGSPEVLAEFGKAGVSKSMASGYNMERGKDASIPAGCAGGTIKSGVHFEDKGTPARFFKCCPLESGDYPPFLYGAKAGRKEKEKGLEGEEKKRGGCLVGNRYETNNKIGARPDIEVSPVANGHPTVKSLSLMRWLCGLVKMPGYNRILDCFCGTGTTIIAAGQLGMEADGIEQDEEYIRIANLRLKAASS